MPTLLRWISSLLLIISLPLYAQDTTPQTSKFISFSDIHFNPFASCKKTCPVVDKLRQAEASGWDDIFEKDDSKAYAEFAHDTNYALLKTSLAEIKAQAVKDQPRFALALGDFLAHDFRNQYIMATHDRSVSGYQSFVKKTLEFLTLEIQKTLPDIDIYPAIGNNDSYIGNYSVQPGGSFLRDTAKTWSGLIRNPENQRSLLGTFSIAGFYVVNLPGENKKLIMLDTVLFSSANRDKSVQQAALLQLKWLNQQLQSAAQQHKSVILAFHIPDGVNVYLTVLSLFHEVNQFWRPDMSKQFSEILKEYGNTVTAMMAGHIHMDSFQVITVDDHSVPVSYTPSISPIYGNNPGFKVYSYDDNLQLTNYDMYYLPLTAQTASRQWQKEYSFNEVYHPHCENCNLLGGMQKLTPSGALANTFKQYYAVGRESQPIVKADYWLPYYWCSIFDSLPATYQTCIKH